MNNFKIMGVDFGKVRLGIALSDLLHILATGIENYDRRGDEKDIAHIIDLVQKNNVKKIVFGMPYNMDGSEGESAKNVKRFVEKLVERYPIDIDFVDERLTSSEAEDILINANYSRKKRKGMLDKVSSEIILQTYLDSMN